MKSQTILMMLSYLAVVFMFNSNAKAGELMSYTEAAQAAAKLAVAPTSEGGLGCSIAKVVKVDETYSSRNEKLLRAVLYADCIECLHVYMFDVKDRTLAFSQSVTISDPVWYKKTCVDDRRRYLGH